MYDHAPYFVHSTLVLVRSCVQKCSSSISTLCTFTLQVNTNITYEEFKDLLSELFAAGGITKERIVVLFFFCSDVAIRSLQRGMDLFSRVISWSLSFITEFVCSWVRSHGGWVSSSAAERPESSITIYPSWTHMPLQVCVC